MRNWKTKRVAFILIGLVLIGLLALGIVYRLRIDRLQGFHAPIYDRDGKYIYYVERTTTGISWGLGYEHFSPPAHIYVLRDRFELRRLELKTGKTQSLKNWPASPLEGRHHRHYRGRLYGLPRARLRWAENGELEYIIRVSLIKVPRSESFGVERRWNNASNLMEEKEAWEPGYFAVTGYNEDAIRDEKELLAPPGAQYFPAAIVAYDHRSKTTEIVLENGDFAAAYSEASLDTWLAQHTRHAEVQRIRTVRDTYARLIGDFKAQGLNEITAALRANKEMQRLGFYPKDDTIIARRLSRAEFDALEKQASRLFRIAVKELQSGVFPDIEAALASPGTEVDKTMGRYVIHRDYENSARLNKAIGNGASNFFVEYRGDVFEITIKRYR